MSHHPPDVEAQLHQVAHTWCSLANEETRFSRSPPRHHFDSGARSISRLETARVDVTNGTRLSDALATTHDYLTRSAILTPSV